MTMTSFDWSLSLATTIVALMCGLVGLFKVANLDPNRPFLRQVGSYTAILIGPLALLAFQWGMVVVQEQMPSKPYDVSATSSEAELMLAASTSYTNINQKQVALRATIEKAFASKQFHVVIDAAREIHSPALADRALTRVMTVLTGKTRIPAIESKAGPTQ